MEEKTLAKQQFGHVPTRTSAAFMKQLLADSEHYTLIQSLPSEDLTDADKLSLWQSSTYVNNFIYTQFEGEPANIGKDFDTQAFTYYHEKTNKTFYWWFSYHFKGRRYRTRGITNPNWTKGYGTNINLDRLYYILTNRFNFGIDFIKVYLDIVVPAIMQNRIESAMSDILEDIGNTIDNAIKAMSLRYTKAGNLDRRYKMTKVVESTFKNLFSSIKWNRIGSKVEDILKTGFIKEMKNGVLVDHSNSEITQKKKKSAYGIAYPEFVASKQFINAIVFDLHMRIA